MSEYLNWFKNEMKGWTTIVWAMWAFGFGFQTSILVANPISWQAVVTYLATLVGLLCTCAMAMGKPINGLFGLVSVVGFIVVNLYAKHYWSVLDQLIFAMAIDIPLMMKWKTWGQNFSAKVRKLGWLEWAFAIGAIIILWVVLRQFAVILGDTQPVIDSFVLSVGATASVLCVLHYANTYTLWLVEDVFNILLWFYALKDGYSPAALPMLVSTIMYTATAVYGQWFSVWHKATR